VKAINKQKPADKPVRLIILVSITSDLGSKKMKLKPLYMCPGCSNHTYSNSMVNRYNILINYRVKSYKMTRGSKRKIIE
jgi:hypothetical protein